MLANKRGLYGKGNKRGLCGSTELIRIVFRFIFPPGPSISPAYTFLRIPLPLIVLLLRWHPRFRRHNRCK